MVGCLGCWSPLDCDSTETEAHGVPHLGRWCSSSSFRLRKRAPADQEGHNRVCVCRVGGPGRAGAAERRRCSMERTAASLLLFGQTHSPDLGPGPWVHIPTPGTWDPFLSFWETIFRVLFARFHRVEGNAGRSSKESWFKSSALLSRHMSFLKKM